MRTYTVTENEKDFYKYKQECLDSNKHYVDNEAFLYEAK